MEEQETSLSDSTVLTAHDDEGVEAKAGAEAEGVTWWP